MTDKVLNLDPKLSRTTDNSGTNVTYIRDPKVSLFIHKLACVADVI